MKTIRVNRIEFRLNGWLVQTECKPAETALELLHRFGMQSVKEVCSEGDCGACTIAIGEIWESKLRYKSITSCIYPATKLHGKHVVTTEGLGTPDKMHFIQKVLFDNHGTQCGFCTPGIVMSVFALLMENGNPSLADFKTALEGNLCRCTGYKHIVKAGEELIKSMHNKLINKNDILPESKEAIIKDLEAIPKEIKNFPMQVEDHYPVDCYLMPKDLDELYMLTSRGGYKFIAGATDLNVESNIRREFSKEYLDISEVIELTYIDELDGVVKIGSTATLTDIMNNAVIQKYFPALVDTIKIMSSTQIRNVATLGGNISNASPVADGASMLLGLEAKLLLDGGCGDRFITLSEFYKGYKDIDLDDCEYIEAIVVPKKNYTYSGFIKSSKRKNVDISSVNSAMSVYIDEGDILGVTIAFGGVKEHPALANKTMEYLNFKPLTDEVIEKAAEIAAEEFTPISDVRGSDEYRSTLIKNHIKKHFERVRNRI